MPRITLPVSSGGGLSEAQVNDLIIDALDDLPDSGSVGTIADVPGLVTALDALAPYQPDAVNQRVLADLAEWIAWLNTNGAQGIIGEIGWPYDNDVKQWNPLAGRYIDRAADSGEDLWVATWASGRGWDNARGAGVHYELAQLINTTSGQPISWTSPAYAPMAARLTDPDVTLGTNVSGFEYGSLGREGFSGQNLGFAYVHSQADFDYLASQGVTLVRLAMAWERMQPTLGAALNATALGQLTGMVTAAGNAGIGVVLNLHNFARYGTGTAGNVVDTPMTVSGAAPNQTHLADFWGRISDAYKNNATVVGYGLMNEPHDLAGGAASWEAISQHVVTSLRTVKSDTKLVMVPGYQYSGLRSWATNHPDGWITDSANNFRYEAHHYWDVDGSGNYGAGGYAAALTQAQAQYPPPSTGGGAALSTENTWTAQQVFADPDETSVITNHLEVRPRWAGGSASLFLNNNDGETFEFFTNSGGDFGVYNANAGNQPFTILQTAPGDSIKATATSVQIKNIDALAGKIINVAAPTAGTDAVNRTYVESGTVTMTNKRINPRVVTAASTATLTPTGDTTDLSALTGQAAALTIAAPTGTPVNGQELRLRIKDNGTAQALTWNAIYRGVVAALPTTTVASRVLYVDFVYNSAETKWDALQIVSSVV